MDTIKEIRNLDACKKIAKKHRAYRQTMAFPRVNLKAYDGYQGLTKREYVATAIMQSLLTGAGTAINGPKMGPGEAAKFSLGYADALLALTGDEWDY